MTFLKKAVQSLEREMKGLGHGHEESSGSLMGQLTKAERVPTLT
jgi:hypothetical protein